MSKLATIKNNNGGADQVQYVEIIEGSQGAFKGTYRDADNNVIDLSSATFEVTARLFEGTPTAAGRDGLTINNLTVVQRGATRQTVTNGVTNATNQGTFDVNYYPTILSQFDNGSEEFSTTETNKINSDTPYIVHYSVKVTIGTTIRILRFLIGVRYSSAS